MKLVTLEGQGERIAGILVGDTVVPTNVLTSAVAAAPLTTVDILELDSVARRDLQYAADEASAQHAIPLAQLTLAPPVPGPEKIICIGVNYGAHADEAARLRGRATDLPVAPILFAKFATSLVGHEAHVVIPPSSDKVDWEAELAVVMGRTATRVAAADALDYVGGYTAFNDVSARDLQKQTSQWTAGKACDTFAPCGPWVVTADELPDPQDVRVQARLNGKTMQDARTDTMLFSVRRLIEFITSVITLRPGDIIATGTPAGVGAAMEPPVFMSPGDVIEVEIDGIGVLRNTVVGASAANRALAGSALA